MGPSTVVVRMCNEKAGFLGHWCLVHYVVCFNCGGASLEVACLSVLFVPIKCLARVRSAQSKPSQMWCSYFLLDGLHVAMDKFHNFELEY